MIISFASIIPLQPRKPNSASGVLNILYLDDIKGTTLVPAVRRAIDQAVAKLKQAGHNVLPFITEDDFWSRGESSCDSCMTVDGMQRYQELLKLTEEPPLEILSGGLLGKAKSSTVLFEAFEKKRQWQQDLLKYWNDDKRFPNGQPAQCLISPVIPTVTLKTGWMRSTDSPDATKFTFQWNTAGKQCVRWERIHRQG